MRAMYAIVLMLIAFLAGWLAHDADPAGKLGAFFSNLFSDARTSVATASAIFALLTLVVQYEVGRRQAVIGTRQAEAARISAEAAMRTATDTGNRTIATMRLQWLESLRNILSEYHSVLMSLEQMNDNDHRLLSNLGTQLDLMLNLDNPDQKRLWEIADKIYNIPEIERRQALDTELMAAGRAVMKAEWERIKRELRGDFL